MTSYFIRRLMLVPVTFLIITFMVYAILRFVPGGPIEQAEARIRMQAMSGEGGASSGTLGDDLSLQLDEDSMRELEEFYSLDQTVPVGYLQWLGLMPRRFRKRVPAVPRHGNEEILERLRGLRDVLEAAEQSLASHLEAKELVDHSGSFYRPVSQGDEDTAARTPPAELPPEVRDQALQLLDRTFGDRAALASLLAPVGYGFAPLHGFLRSVEPSEHESAPAYFGEATRLLRLRDEAAKSLEEAFAKTGYELTAHGELRQLAFRPLVKLRSVEQEAVTRLEAHLQQEGMIEFQGRFYRSLTDAEKRPAALFEQADRLVLAGFGKRDNLLQLLSRNGLTWTEGTYYALVSDEAQALGQERFETARQLVAARYVAADKLTEIEEKRGFTVTPDGRIYELDDRFSGILQLDFGRSYTRGEPVLRAIVSKFEVSVQFGLIGYLLTWTVCVPLGVLKAIKHRSFFDTASSVAVFLGYAMPGFVVCLVLLATVAANVDWLPLGGYKPENIEQLGNLEAIVGRIRHMLIPVTGYMIGGFATMTILMKNSLMENLSQDYVRTAVAKGLSHRRVIFVHALRNSLIPITAGIGHALGLLFAGSFLIEKTCNIDGMGLLGFQAIVERDYPIILGVLVFGVLIRLFGNIISDVVWALIDPRIRFGT
ncbi:ABC transporter permease subunit [Planctomycetota bacterium]